MLLIVLLFHIHKKGMLVKLLLGKKALRRNDKKPVEGVGGEFYYVNGISVAQGPNYGACNETFVFFYNLFLSNKRTSYSITIYFSLGKAHATLACSYCTK
jgi:hypothetical protein